MATAKLYLSDGTLFTGTHFGAEGEVVGDIVFNTGMTGYQEVMSDPSYAGQIVTFTYPLIGNYGINRDDFESLNPWARGIIVREHATAPSNWRSRLTLDDLMRKHGLMGISGIDTRMLTRLLRTKGVMRGILTTRNRSEEELKQLLTQHPVEHRLVEQVSTREQYRIPGKNGLRVAVIDYGCKHGILHELTKRGLDVIIVPYNTPAETILGLQPDGIMLSNGPGDPKDLMYSAVPVIRRLLGAVPIFGICLGHQLLALACGADTTKLKFGHRGSNHPVKEIATGRCSITSQNHDYAVTVESLSRTELVLTHINNNDGSVEGLRHARFPAFSVQYHPEANPGPHDSLDLFDRFVEMMIQHRAERSPHSSGIEPAKTQTADQSQHKTSERRPHVNATNTHTAAAIQAR